jgi:hypothetical protein
MRKSPLKRGLGFWFGITLLRKDEMEKLLQDMTQRGLAAARQIHLLHLGRSI